MSAEVKNYHGTPTLFLDGKPIFDGLMWGSPPTLEGYALKECARLYGEAGIHLFAFDMGTGGTPPDWCGPRPGRESPYDFSTLAMRFNQVIAVDPRRVFTCGCTLKCRSGGKNCIPRNARSHPTEGAWANLLPPACGGSRQRNVCKPWLPTCRALGWQTGSLRTRQAPGIPVSG